MTQSNRKVVKQKTVLTAPNLRRFGAWALDLLLYVFLILFASLVLSTLGIVDVNDVNSLNNLVLMNLVIFGMGVVYYFVVPMMSFGSKLKGQTFGKQILKLRTIQTNGEDISVKGMAIRALFGLFVEGFTYFLVTLSLLQFLAFVAFDVTVFTNYLLSAYIIIFLISVVLMIIRPSHQMLHDYVASTVVILVDQRR